MKAREEVPTCGKCHRDDCGLMATIIIGARNFYAAAMGCFHAQRQRQVRR